MAKKIEKVVVPDIGGASNVDVIEVLVKEGEKINPEDSLITLEGDKATMEVPSPLAGIIKKVVVKAGDKVSAGDIILELEKDEEGDDTATKSAVSDKSSAETTDKISEKKPEKAETTATVSPAPVAKTAETSASPATAEATTTLLAGPSARRLAREVGVDLALIAATGEKGRIRKEDVQQYIKQRMNSGSGINLPAIAAIDFSKFGEVSKKPLSKIQKISGATLHRNWMSIPHVTQFDEVDITDMENFRQQQKDIAEKQGIKLTPLVFIMKAVVAALKKYPNFNASLDANGEHIILKKYFHVGVAVDTPNGLVVPVIRDVDQKGFFELAKELATISKKVRDTGLSLADMQGGCFSISSLGGIGGTAFTPIINAPEVAILGVSKSVLKPVYQVDGQLAARLLLPLSLSYDHRVIDGADAARFIVYLNQCLADIRTLLL